MGWKDNLLICSFFVSAYLLTQAKCGLQKDLDEMKIKCGDSYKVAKDNIDGLKKQLDDLFKQVSATKSPAKDVLNILQKVIDLQEMDALTITERDGAKIEALELSRKEAERDLSEMKKEFLGSVEMFKRAELKKYLENKLKQPGEQGGIANQVLQIVTLQIEAMELKIRLSGKYKTQAQMDATTSKLEHKNYILADLKEEREERKENIQKIDKLIAALEKEILDLNTELTTLKQTLAQLNGQTKEFDGKRTEVMDKIAKLKDELISRILTLQFEFMEALITANGQKNADDFVLADLQKELEKEQDRALYLDIENKSLRRKLFAQTEECKDMMALYINLKRIRDEKLKDLKAKKEELQKSGASPEKSVTGSLCINICHKVLKVISQMEEIWKLQSEKPDNLNQISNLQKDLLKLITELDDKMTAKPKLQKALDEVKRTLNEKNKELAAATGDTSQLQKDINLLNKEVLKLKKEKDTAEQTAQQKIKDLEENLKQSNKALEDTNKSLKDKDAVLSQQLTKISNLFEEARTLKQQVQEKESLVNARMAELERNLKKEEEENSKIRDENEKLKESCVDTHECPELQKKYKGYCVTEMQAEYNDTISKLNSDILQKVFFITSLIEEVKYLDKQIAQGFPGLREEVEEKKRELEEAKQQLKDKGSMAAKTLEVLELLAEIGKLQENPTVDNSEKIQQLDAKLNDLLTELQKSGEKGLGLSLKKQIEDKEKEILLLKANCGQSTTQLQERIKQLEEEAEESKQKMKKLQQESSDKIAALEKQIKTKDQQLANTEDKLQETNAENAALIKKLNGLNDDIQKITEEKNNALQKAKEEIVGLNDKLQRLENTLAKQNLYLKEKDDTISELKELRDNMKTDLENAKKKNKELETELKTKDQQLAKTDAKLQEKNDENEALLRKQEKLEKELKRITEEKNTLQNKLQEEISDLKNTLETQKQDLAKKDQKLQEKDKEVDELQKENVKIKAEIRQEKDKFNNAINENENLKQELNEAKKRVDELEKEKEEKEELPKEEWPGFDANTAHRRLILSQDEKEARTSFLAQPVPNNPERYDTAVAALAKDGYDSGKHYWEIGVVGRNCYVLGVAKSSAQRKGILTYGPSAGYWVILKKRDGALLAIDDKQVQIDPRGTPSAIGVQVDFKNKVVIFYNAERKQEIYRFTGNGLQGKVYPYVETCSDTNDPPVILRKVQSIDWLKP
ncbi:Erythroid membrane-associated protein [Anabarilius grahami]|uniref:Erythroid membrane-associated protein n=1 Tax=Anabarilius grahami TaxID=495550 RepID=A0A3N0Z9S9_ANAGA|nr:Erythroid membrane-associated protein [Anabarilius grahami]